MREGWERERERERETKRGRGRRREREIRKNGCDSLCVESLEQFLVHFISILKGESF